MKDLFEPSPVSFYFDTLAPQTSGFFPSLLSSLSYVIGKVLLFDTVFFPMLNWSTDMSYFFLLVLLFNAMTYFFIFLVQFLFSEKEFFYR